VSHGVHWFWFACKLSQTLSLSGAALDPPLWTVVPNKALSLSLSLSLSFGSLNVFSIERVLDRMCSPKVSVSSSAGIESNLKFFLVLLL